MPLVNRVTIVGLGLIGGSLGMAIRHRGLAREVVGLSRSPATLRRAKARRAIHRGTTDVRKAVADADLVILATPVDAVVPMAKRLARFMRAGSVLTDVASTKAGIVGAVERSLPDRVRFVGGHPLAGSEQRGIGVADGRLFDAAGCVLTPTAQTDRRALRMVRELWRRLGARVVTLSPHAHDRVLAGMSHLPHLLACCLAVSGSSPRLPSPPRSWLEMTRIAESDPDLWDDIYFTNRQAVRQATDRFDRQWRILLRLLARGDRAALRRLLVRAKTIRASVGP